MPPIIVHWNGHGWKQVPSHSPGTTSQLFGVAAASANNAWAVGQTSGNNPPPSARHHDAHPSACLNGRAGRGELTSRLAPGVRSLAPGQQTRLAAATLRERSQVTSYVEKVCDAAMADFRKCDDRCHSGGRKAVQGWIYDRLELERVQRSDWSQTGVDTWRVGLAEEPAEDQDGRPVTVTIAVLDRKGEPCPDQADRLRRYLGDHDFLSRNPKLAELEMLDEATSENRALAFKRTRRAHALIWGGRPQRGAP